MNKEKILAKFRHAMRGVVIDQELICDKLDKVLSEAEDEWCPNSPLANNEVCFCGKPVKANTAEDECYLDNFMCAFCNHFQIDTSDFDMTAFLKDWLQEDKE